MTCPAHRASTVVDVLGHGIAMLSVAVGRSMQSAWSRVTTFATGSGSASQFARFCFVGGVSSALYVTLFLVVDSIDSQLANTAGAIGSTLLANELHRLLTFQAGSRVSWLTAQIEGGGLAIVALAGTSLALAALHQVVGDTSSTTQLLLIGAVTGLIGLVRFVALRAWVFKAEPAEDDATSAAHAHPAPTHPAQTEVPAGHAAAPTGEVSGECGELATARSAPA